MQRQLPAFTTSEWYSNPTEHRCPHDAWLEALEIGELATGERSEQRVTTITLKLLGAYQDGHIILRYIGVKNYALEGRSCGRGMGDWLHDEMSVSATGGYIHQITWAGFGADGSSGWLIEADDVTYEWIPQKS